MSLARTPCISVNRYHFPLLPVRRRLICWRYKLQRKHVCAPLSHCKWNNALCSWPPPLDVSPAKHQRVWILNGYYPHIKPRFMALTMECFLIVLFHNFFFFQGMAYICMWVNCQNKWRARGGCRRGSAREISEHLAADNCGVAASIYPSPPEQQRRANTAGQGHTRRRGVLVLCRAHPWSFHVLARTSAGTGTSTRRTTNFAMEKRCCERGEKEKKNPADSFFQTCDV